MRTFPDSPMEPPSSSPMVENGSLLENSVRSLEIPNGDAISWLTMQERGSRFYWRSRDGGEEFAASGVTVWPADLEGAQRLACQPGMIVLGAMDFDVPGEEWPGKTSFGLRVPRRVLHRVHGRTRLFLYDPADDEDSAKYTVVSSSKMSPPLSRVDLPTETAWSAVVAGALLEIENGAFSKVVLARRTRLQFAAEPDPLTLLRGLQTAASDCFFFLMESAWGCWLGAPPEMLYSRTGCNLVTEAVAGTCPRGATAADDEALGHSLLEDKKENEEHFAVVDMIRGVLEKFSQGEVSSSRRRLLRLRRVQHLMTQFSSHLAKETSDADLLRALHPTPATSGWPVDAARDWLRQNEPFSRGCYAGPVGWMMGDRATFCVALRSAFLHGRVLDLYAGGGIVRASKAELEWRELDSKIGDWLSLFEA